jgi:DNA polymerase
MLVGEAPGDQEDRQGRPFVGPAGRLLSEALSEAGLNEPVYVTNAVKHLKWTPRGKRRLHAKPKVREVNACWPWLHSEIEALHPQAIVCLGATAAQALFGRQFRVTQDRGRLLPSEWAEWALATYHPSAVLRAPYETDRRRMRAEFVADLRTAIGALKSPVAGVARSVG